MTHEWLEEVRPVGYGHSHRGSLSGPPRPLLASLEPHSSRSLGYPWPGPMGRQHLPERVGTEFSQEVFPGPSWNLLLRLGKIHAVKIPSLLTFRPAGRPGKAEEGKRKL